MVQLHGGAGRRLAHELARAGAGPVGVRVLRSRGARRVIGRYAFGTWKVEVLGGYTSAILLLGIAALMVFQSVERLMSPQTIHYRRGHRDRGGGSRRQSGLRLVAARVTIMHTTTTHARCTTIHTTMGSTQDMNMRSAYLHVLADAATSVLAIVALARRPAVGLRRGWIRSWAWWARRWWRSGRWGLLRDSGRILLDAEMDAPVVAEVREVIERGTVPATITDLHVWRVGRAKYAVVLSITTSSSEDGEYFRRALSVHEELAHVTVEVTHATSDACA